ncbi:hypothetical protein [Alicyclobacillus sp.]|uniref:hypothetical protein n=1 Tax=Alicyclobacillus sp. TaxID=61169 RepID=UPI0025B8354F|nr:hypothetical protein [Alicyclobacillus sp.]MCL6515959.1 hypothetical protein [Alicyclobacillus sp.]
MSAWRGRPDTKFLTDGLRRTDSIQCAAARSRLLGPAQFTDAGAPRRDDAGAPMRRSALAWAAWARRTAVAGWRRDRQRYFPVPSHGRLGRA